MDGEVYNRTLDVTANTTNEDVKNNENTRTVLYTLGAIFTLFGFLGNVVCVKILTKIQKTTPGIRLIKYLAITDAIFTLSGLIIQILFIAVEEEIMDITYRCFSFVLDPIAFTFELFENYLTCLISFQRCWPLAAPLKYAQLLRDSVINKLLVTITVFSILFCIPVWVAYRPHLYWNDVFNMTLVDFNQNNIRSDEFGFYRIILKTVFGYGIPIAVLIVCNVTLIISRQKMPVIDRNDKKAADQLTLVVIAITLMSCIMNGLWILYQILTAYEDAYKFETLLYISQVVTLLNCSTNFIFYCTFGREFRRILFAMFKRGRRAAPQLPPVLDAEL